MPGGRPTKLDAEAANAIVAILQKGLTIDDACEAAGIDDSTFQRWLRRGEKAAKARELKPEEKPFREFCAAVKKARAVGKITLVQRIENASVGDELNPADWKAAAWLLERMHPHQFGRKYIRIEAAPVAGDGTPLPDTKAPPPTINLVIEGGADMPPEGEPVPEVE